MRQEEARAGARLAREEAQQARLGHAAQQARAEALHAEMCQLRPGFEGEDVRSADEVRMPCP